MSSWTDIHKNACSNVSLFKIHGVLVLLGTLSLQQRVKKLSKNHLPRKLEPRHSWKYEICGNEYGLVNYNNGAVVF
jgi:hypothetical protein